MHCSGAPIVKDKVANTFQYYCVVLKVALNISRHLANIYCLLFSNPYSYEELAGYFTRPNGDSPTPTPPPPPDMPLLPAPPPPMFGHTFTDPM